MRKSLLIANHCLLYAMLLVAATTAHASDSPTVWAIGDCHKINPETGKDYNPFVPKDIAKHNYLWDSRTNTVTLFGAKNEWVSFQIIIEAKNEDLKDVNVTFSDLTGPGTINKDNIKLFKEHYTNVWQKSDWPQPSTGLGAYPDALIPFEVPEFGAPFSVKKKSNQAIWVDVHIPDYTETGEYNGSFAVYVNGSKIKEIKVVLTVWNFSLPEKNHLIFWSNYGEITRDYNINESDPRYINIEKSIWKIAHEHRLNALLRHAHIRPGINFDNYGLAVVDFRPYAERLGAYLDGSLFKNKLPPDIFLLPLSGGAEYRWPGNGPVNDPDATFSYVCKEFAAYFKEMGWGLNNRYIYLGDEPGQEALDKIVHDADLIHKASKDLKTLAALSNVFNAETLRKLAGSIDLWLIDASHYNSKLLAPRKELGEKTGFYQQGEPWCGNENLDSDGIGFVTWPWIAWKYKVDCLYMYHMTVWGGLQKGHSIWDYSHNQSWSNSQGVLVYPGSYIGIDDVVGSIRLKQIRRGMQDYEYMYLAKENGKNPDDVVNTLIGRALDEANRPEGNYGEWSHNPEDWFLARKNIAALILGSELTPMRNVKIPKANIAKDKLVPLKSSFRNLKSKIKSYFLKLPKKIKYPLLALLGKARSVSASEAVTANNKAVSSPEIVNKELLNKTIKVSIHPSIEKGRVSSLLYGTNFGPEMESDYYIWNFIKNIGITCLHYPGGGTPGWHWKTGIADFEPKMQNMPLSNIDYLIKFCEKVNVKNLIIQVNIESGTPQEAAEFVEHMNKIRNFKVEYWEIGGEVQGDWDRAHTTPEKYAQIIKEYSLAMKAKDPTIKIGADWAGPYFDSVNWDRTVIKLAGDYIDFISIHWYPDHTNKKHPFKNRIHPTSEEIMSNSMHIPNIISRLNKIVAEEAPQRAGKIEPTFLEWDGSWDAPADDPSPYTKNVAIWSLANAIFYADCLGQFAENGVTVSAHYDLQECMFGLIRGWDSAEGWGGQKWDTVTIRPKAFSIQLFAKHFGDILIESKVENSPYYYKEEDYWPDSYSGNVPYVTCYASKFTDENKLGIILINKHPEKSFDMKISIEEATRVASTADIWLLTGPELTSQNDGQPRTVGIQRFDLKNVSNEFAYQLPAHSVVAMELRFANEAT